MSFLCLVNERHILESAELAAPCEANNECAPSCTDSPSEKAGAALANRSPISKGECELLHTTAIFSAGPARVSVAFLRDDAYIACTCTGLSNPMQLTSVALLLFCEFTAVGEAHEAPRFHRCCRWRGSVAV